MGKRDTQALCVIHIMDGVPISTLRNLGDHGSILLEYVVFDPLTMSLTQLWIKHICNMHIYRCNYTSFCARLFNSARLSPQGPFYGYPSLSCIKYWGKFLNALCRIFLPYSGAKYVGGWMPHSTFFFNNLCAYICICISFEEHYASTVTFKAPSHCSHKSHCHSGRCACA